MPATVSHQLSATTPDDPAYEIRPSHWNSAHAVTLSATHGTELIGAFSNANGISFGTSGAGGVTQVTGSHNALTSQSGQAFSAQGGSSAFQTLSFSNANGISFSNNAGQVQASYTVPSVTNSTLTISDAATSIGIARLAFTNANGLTLSLSTAAGGSATVVGSYTVPTVTAGSDTAGISNLGNTAGTSGVVSGDSIRVLFAGGNNITLSQSINGVSATITISGANAGGAQTGISGVVVSDTTYTSGTVSFSNAGNITISSSVNGATQYIRLSGNAAQTNQSAIKALGVSNTGNTAGNTGMSTGIDWVIAGSNGITASQSTAGGGPNTIWISGVTTAAQTNQSAIKGFGASNTGNTAGNTGISTGIDWVVAGSNGITISESTAGGGPNTLWVSGVTTAAQTNQSAIKALGVSNTGNTAGNTGLSTGIDWVIAGSNGITASQSTAGGGPNTIWISGPGAGGGGLTNINVSAGTTSNNLSDIVFSDSNNVSFGLNGSTITAKARAFLEKWPQYFSIGAQSLNSGTSGNTGASTQLTVQPKVFPLQLEADLTYNQIAHAFNWATTAGTHSATIGFWGALYTASGGTLSLLTDKTWQWNMIWSQNSVTAVTGSWWWGTNSNANSSGLAGNNSASFTATRWALFSEGAGSLSAGQYWLLFGHSQRTAGAANSSSSVVGNILRGQINNVMSLGLGGSTLGTMPLFPFGAFSTTTNTNSTGFGVFPSSIHTSALTTAPNTAWAPEVFFNFSH